MTQPSEKQSRERQVKIEISEDVADGHYANIAFITSNNSEFIIDFARYMPGNSRGKVISRIIMNPIQAKGLVKSLSESVERFEKNFGPISPESDNKSIGFSINSEEKSDKEKK